MILIQIYHSQHEKVLRLDTLSQHTHSACLKTFLSRNQTFRWLKSVSLSVVRCWTRAAPSRQPNDLHFCVCSDDVRAAGHRCAGAVSRAQQGKQVTAVNVKTGCRNRRSSCAHVEQGLRRAFKAAVSQMETVWKGTSSSEHEHIL